jgi:hypothetical protein
MKQLFFLSGSARSGSTLLGSILNQNPLVYVSPTSPLLDLYCMTEESLQKLSQQYTVDFPTIGPAIHRQLHRSFYSHIHKPYVIDKHRGWPKNIPTIKQIITNSPRVIATYRPMAEMVTSFLKLMRSDPDNVIDRDLVQNNKELTTRNRALWLMNNYAMDPFLSFKQGLEEYPECMHIVKYHDLVRDPTSELLKIYQFLDLDFYEGHTFTNISNTCAENDIGWGFKNLHDIRPNLNKTSDNPLDVLGKELVDYFATFDQQLKVVR